MQKKEACPEGVKNASALKQEVEFRERLLEITNRVHAASNIDEILIDLKDEVTRLFHADRITIYVVDGIKKELVSRVKTGNEISEIRVPISKDSLVGYVAHRGVLINVKDVYNSEEVAAIDPELTFDKTWDQKSGYRTR
ncbi:MAG: pilus assembly protein, partial [Deltaproteobacteria bacterium]|nr:pilus assembly protein [Deltaproteobacteria bacterium]